MHDLGSSRIEPIGRTTLRRNREILIPNVVLNRGTREALHRQITRQIAEAIRNDALSADFCLPSTRVMARVLGVSRNTVVAAYEELVAAGLIRAFRGAGTRVDAAAPLSGTAAEGARRLLDDAHFPANVSQIEDADGNLLYLRY